jgi:hypothetical protein
MERGSARTALHVPLGVLSILLVSVLFAPWWCTAVLLAYAVLWQGWYWCVLFGVGYDALYVLSHAGVEFYMTLLVLGVGMVRYVWLTVSNRNI